VVLRFDVDVYREIVKNGKIARSLRVTVLSQLSSALNRPVPQLRRPIIELEELGLITVARNQGRYAWVAATPDPLRLVKVLEFPKDEQAAYVAQVLLGLDVVKLSDDMTVRAIAAIIAEHSAGYAALGSKALMAFAGEVSRALLYVASDAQ
jgi:hypothetical protein